MFQEKPYTPIQNLQEKWPDLAAQGPEGAKAALEAGWQGSGALAYDRW